MCWSRTPWQCGRLFSGGASLFHDAQKEDRGTKDCVYPSKTHLCDYFLQLGHFSSETAQQGTKHLRYEPGGRGGAPHVHTMAGYHHLISYMVRKYFSPPIGGFPLLPSFAFAMQKLFIACDIPWGSVFGDRECMGPCVC